MWVRSCGRRQWKDRRQCTCVCVVDTYVPVVCSRQWEDTYVGPCVCRGGICAYGIGGSESFACPGYVPAVGSSGRIDARCMYTHALGTFLR